MIREFFTHPGSPCPKCGVRPDLACEHRVPDAGWRPPEQPAETDQRKILKDSGRNFANRDRTIVSGGGAYRITAARRAGLLKGPTA